MAQKMMVKELESKLPRLYETDGKGDEAIAYGHWFTSNADWFASEYDPDTGDCFGLVRFHGMPAELGYFNLHEFEQINLNPWRKTPDGRLRFIQIERDLHWDARTIGECREY